MTDPIPPSLRRLRLADATEAVEEQGGEAGIDLEDVVGAGRES